MRALLRFIRSVALYLGVVVGGVTFFMIVAPVFGYLPYSDRPGPGWYATFPAIGPSEFLANAWEMLGLGVFFAILMVQVGALCVLLVRLMERLKVPTPAVRVLGALATALLSGYGVAGVGWYVSLGGPAVLLSLALGAAAGGCVLPRRAPRPVGA